MKRRHIDLTLRKPGYAHWMPDEPPVDLAVSMGPGRPGVDHPGIQSDTLSDLAVLRSRLRAAGQRTRDDREVTCCCAWSETSWIADPREAARGILDTRHGDPAVTSDRDVTDAAWCERLSTPSPSTPCSA